MAVVLGLSAALLAGCGAGGGPSSGAPSTTPSQGTGRAVFTIDWPAVAPAGRLIPAATQSIGIVVSLNGTTVASSEVDRPTAGGQSVITLNNLPSGTLTDTVTAYPQTGGQGTPLAIGSGQVTITAGQNTAVSLTLTSSIDHLVVTPAAPMVIGGQTLQLMATAVDVSGAMVLTTPGDIKWSSATATVATVDNTGKVSALDPGQSAITVTESESGKTGGTNVTVPTPAAMPMPQPATMVLPSDGSVTMTSPSPGTLVLSGAVPAVQPGSVLVSGAGNGMAVKVMSVSQNGGSTTAQTVPATLEDIFQQADVVVNKTLGPSDYQSITPTDPGVTVISPGAARGRDVFSITFGLGGVKLGDLEKAEVDVSGSVTLSVALDLEIEVDWRGVKHIRFVPTVTDSLDLTFDGKLSASFASYKKKIAHLMGEPIDIQVGVVPVVFTPVLDVYMKADGSIEGGLEFSSTLGLTVGAGAEYIRGSGWHMVTTAKTTNTFAKPDAIAYAGFDASWTPYDAELDLLLYGAAGPYAEIQEPKLDLKLQQNSAPPSTEFTLGGDFTASSGFKLEAVGHDIADVDFPGSLDEHFNIVDVDVPYNGQLNVGVQ